MKPHLGLGDVRQCEQRASLPSLRDETSAWYLFLCAFAKKNCRKYITQWRKARNGFFKIF